MSIRKYYIPPKDKDFGIFQANLVNIVVINAPAWGIPAPSVTALTNRRLEFEPLFTIAENKTTRRSADVVKYRVCRKIYEKEIRAFVQAWLTANPLVTDDQRREMALTIMDKKPTPRGKIGSVPIIGLRVLGGGSLEVRARVTTDQTRPSMHALADAVECKFIFVPVGELPPEDPDACTRTQTSKKARFAISCGVKNAGQSFWGFFRWTNLTTPANSGDWTTKAQGAVIG